MRITKIKILFIFAFLLLYVSEIKAQDLLQKGEIPDDLVITLERTFCLGDCPVYKLTIKADGILLFEGEEYTKKKGLAKTKIKPEKIKQIISEFEKADFFSLRNKYEDFDVCEMYATDHPSEIISIQINGKSKQVNHNFGCWGEKAKKELTPLVSLGEKIDEITNSKRWVGKQK
jgi:hypothetical protein